LLTVETTKKIVKMYPTVGIYRLGVYAEPTLNPQIGDIAESILAKDKMIALSTNGTRIAAIKEAFPWTRTSSILVSLNAATDDEYERRMGKPFFGRVCEGISYLVSLGVHPTLGFVVSRKNLHRTPHYVEFARSLGVKSVTLTSIIGDFQDDPGNGQLLKNFWEQEAITSRELVDVWRNQTNTSGLKVGWPRIRKPGTSTKVCSQVLRRFEVDAEGNVALCCGGPGPRPEMGNIFADPEAYNKGPVAELRARVLRVSGDVPDKCRTCRIS
jgi:sulfatase maturation enzyme AslB (radical SAM superfamily)